MRKRLGVVVLTLAATLVGFAVGGYFVADQISKRSTLPEGQVAFCQVGHELVNSESMVIDLPNKRIFGSDTSSTLTPIISDEMSGFETPFPLAVPVKGQALKEWSSPLYKYTISRVEDRDDGWVIVFGSPLETSDNYTTSSVVYSLTEGVIAIKIMRWFEEESYVTEFYRCGPNRFFPSQLAG